MEAVVVRTVVVPCCECVVVDVVLGDHVVLAVELVVDRFVVVMVVLMEVERLGRRSRQASRWM